MKEKDNIIHRDFKKNSKISGPKAPWDCFPEPESPEFKAVTDEAKRSWSEFDARIERRLKAYADMARNGILVIYHRYNHYDR